MRYQATVWTGDTTYRLDEVPAAVRAEIETAIHDRERASGKVIHEGREYRWGLPRTLEGKPILDGRAYGGQSRCTAEPGWMRTPTGS